MLEAARQNRRALYFGACNDLRREFGAAALARVDRALEAHLRKDGRTPADPRQRPRFFYFPELPSLPYLDPYAHPWAAAVADAFPAVRDEALRMFEEDRAAAVRDTFEDFVRVRPGDRMENYLAGPRPSWEAFFFYRHGRRFDDNHARCPATSRLLESIERCEIADHAPEICFSLLEPGTHILPHHGVTNVRSVMHLPLQVPPDCALNLLGAGEHQWREGQLVMFDDTFRHEAWNRSGQVRLILLMDCWNPGLTPVERRAMACLIETIGRAHRATRATPAQNL